MEKVLIDSDIIIDFLRGYSERIKKLFEMIESAKIIPCTTLVNLVELYSGEDIKEKDKENILLELLSHFEMILLDEKIAKNAGLFRQKYGLGLADSIITATVVEKNIKLATCNTKHFSKISEIKLFNF